MKWMIRYHISYTYIIYRIIYVIHHNDSCYVTFIYPCIYVRIWCDICIFMIWYMIHIIFIYIISYISYSYISYIYHIHTYYIIYHVINIRRKICVSLNVSYHEYEYITLQIQGNTYIWYSYILYIHCLIFTIRYIYIQNMIYLWICIFIALHLSTHGAGRE